MPPRELSRHYFTSVVRDSKGRLKLTRRTPYRYRPLADTELREVRDSDTLYSLAGAKYEAFDPERACGLWWVIADFQPDPIHDPTVALQVGRILHIPSIRTLREEIFAEDRREE